MGGLRWRRGGAEQDGDVEIAIQCAVITVDDGSSVEWKDATEMDGGDKARRAKYVVNFVLPTEVSGGYL